MASTAFTRSKSKSLQYKDLAELAQSDDNMDFLKGSLTLFQKSLHTNMMVSVQFVFYRYHSKKNTCKSCPSRNGKT